MYTLLGQAENMGCGKKALIGTRQLVISNDADVNAIVVFLNSKGNVKCWTRSTNSKICFQFGATENKKKDNYLTLKIRIKYDSPQKNM